MVKFDKKAAVIGAVTGGVAGAVGTSTSLNFLETIAVACIVGSVVAIIIELVWK